MPVRSPGSLFTHLNFSEDVFLKANRLRTTTGPLDKEKWEGGDPRRRAAYCLLEADRSPFGRRFDAWPSGQSAARGFAPRNARTDGTRTQANRSCARTGDL